MPDTSVFLYGTLLDPRVFHRQAGTLRPWRRGVPARLRGYRRVALRGTPYPTLLRAEGEVGGLLVLLPAPQMARLRIYEGPLYALIPIRLVTACGPRMARAWSARERHADAERSWTVPISYILPNARECERSRSTRAR
jgi:hypothetical protein